MDAEPDGRTVLQAEVDHDEPGVAVTAPAVATLRALVIVVIVVVALVVVVSV
jgi:hypothetical protein